ncbi:ATP-binding protein [Herbaspirillum sp.]|uniref:sensor histidine kinase n=1 Tax=Herbaspirillum sp. TaxID=1890675 RepID=UPI001B0B3B20|nr:ATP-binding protein [Herbaspirillum sp.]MBO9535165.1 HAMP domain-containing protein [Herbaspirillum sp.]
MLGFRQRMLLVHLVAVVVIVTCAAAAGWWLLSQSVRGQLDAALLALAETESGLLAENHADAIRVHEPAAGSAPPSLVRLDRLVQIVDARGDVVARSNNLGVAQLPVSPALLAQMAQGQTVFQTFPHVIEEPLRIVSTPVTVDGKLFAVQVAGSLDDVNHILQSAALLFGGLAAALLVALSVAGTVLTRTLFGTVERVAAQARRIGDANLSERLAHPGTDDELGHLVETLNSMLARLEHAFALQRSFTANASHEIRSPLSRLRTEIELALRRPREAQAYVETLHSCLDEVERLTSIVEELLLARLDAGQETIAAETVSLAELAQDCAERLRPAAGGRQVEIRVSAPAAVLAKVGHRAAALVLDNLIDNAIKFSPPHTAIRVEVGKTAELATVTVADSGPGIVESDMPHLFDRFYRGSASQSGEIAGAGLGLAIAKTVMDFYGARIDVANLDGHGAAFTLGFPLAD